MRILACWCQIVTTIRPRLNLKFIAVWDQGAYSPLRLAICSTEKRFFFTTRSPFD